MIRPWHISSLLLFACGLPGLYARPTPPSELKSETIAAFNEYVQATGTRMESDLRDGHFLYLDNFPEESRLKTIAQLRNGMLYIEQLHTLEEGMPIRIPSGMIHHWIGIAFMPRVTLNQTLAILLDYRRQEEIYKPDIRKSRLLARDGNKSKLYLQLFKKSMVTVVYNAEFDVDFHMLSKTRAETTSVSTRIAEVQNPGTPQEHELPIGNDHGYLWRLNTHWRIEEKDGGVYIQVESVALSRRIPPVFTWFVAPAIRKLSYDVVANLLTQTHNAVKNSYRASAESDK